MHIKSIGILSIIIICLSPLSSCHAQRQVNSKEKNLAGKEISPDLFGLFFEDINYSADGGLYAELVQNRSFELSPTDRREWHPLAFWEYVTPGFSYGALSVESKTPVHPNNPHYVVLNIEHVGAGGVGLRNKGFSNLRLEKAKDYTFSMFSRRQSLAPVTVQILLKDKDEKVLDWKEVEVKATDWEKLSVNLRPSRSADSCSLVVLAVTEGEIALDMISLFPEQTYKQRDNGLREDLAGILADMQPAFIRFPGGCLVHGDGIGNMYRWKNTVGPVEQRKGQKNLWGYHQTAGLGFYEYFQFCEDIGAKPLPVLPAGVSCQNSGGTWRTGSNGQQALPLEEMDEYVQEVFDLVEWANGPASSPWGSVRAAAGHPEPFGLEYIGIGNEDNITPEFSRRFRMIHEALKNKHPEITIVGTSGPGADGEDFEKGWAIADSIQVAVVDEHYYMQPEWFLNNLQRYDAYDREKSAVYLGEYASWGNKLKNAISEAAFMIGLERNGDIVRMSSYAPLFAKKGNTQWHTDMVFFDNADVSLTPNYYVQKLFSVNSGNYYFERVVRPTTENPLLAASCVRDDATGDIILKIVNADSESGSFAVDLKPFKSMAPVAQQTLLTGDPEAENTLGEPDTIVPVESSLEIEKAFTYQAPAMSLTVIRIKSAK